MSQLCQTTTAESHLGIREVGMRLSQIPAQGCRMEHTNGPPGSRHVEGFNRIEGSHKSDLHTGEALPYRPLRREPKLWAKGSLAESPWSPLLGRGTHRPH